MISPQYSWVHISFKEKSLFLHKRKTQASFWPGKDKGIRTCLFLWSPIIFWKVYNYISLHLRSGVVFISPRRSDFLPRLTSDHSMFVTSSSIIVKSVFGYLRRAIHLFSIACLGGLSCSSIEICLDYLIFDSIGEGRHPKAKSTFLQAKNDLRKRNFSCGLGSRTNLPSELIVNKASLLIQIKMHLLMKEEVMGSKGSVHVLLDRESAHWALMAQIQQILGYRHLQVDPAQTPREKMFLRIWLQLNFQILTLGWFSDDRPSTFVRTTALGFSFWGLVMQN